MNPKVYIVIVTFNGMIWYNRCFGSICNSSLETEIIIVDNASTDSTVKFIKEKYPKFHLIENKMNLGFARANNIGIKNALVGGADFVFLLNQDAWVEMDTISVLIDVFNNVPDAGVVSPIHLNGSNTGLDTGFANYISPSSTPDFVSDLYIGKLGPWYKTAFVNAAAWLISRKCIEKVGGFDTSLFFHYGEDDNYCQRVRYHNFGIYISTLTTICHDREDRIGIQSEMIEKERSTLPRKVYYANLELDDKVIDNELNSLNNSYKRKILKYVLMLKFNEIKKLNKYTYDELQFFTKIKKSREANKISGNPIWLNELSSSSM